MFVVCKRNVKQMERLKETFCFFYSPNAYVSVDLQGFFPVILEKKAPVQNWEKMIDLPSKLGEINDIEHYKGNKIYPQNQVVLDCIIAKHTT